MSKKPIYIETNTDEYLIIGKAISKWEAITGMKAGYRAFIVRCAKLYLEGKVEL